MNHMMPGMNPRKMQKLMKQMGMKQNEINALKVTIETPDGTLVFDNPEVTETKIQGQSTFQVVGSYTMQQEEIEVPDDDVELVVAQTNVTKEQARTALEKAKGDIAQAIVELQGEGQ